MTQSTACDTSKWSVFEEMRLFQALIHNKPVGVNKHFAIIKLVDQLNTSTGKRFTIPEMWSFLSTLFDIDALDEYETLPFPNEVVDFSLPDAEFPDTVSDIGSESDVRNSVADSLELELTVNESKPGRSKTDKIAAAAEEGTPKRPPKRTRASTTNTPTPTSESALSVKRRRV